MNTKIVRGIFVAILLFWGLISGITPVKALGTPQIVSISPSSPQPAGTQVTIHAKVTWDDDFRSMRICFGGTDWCQEEATPDFSKTFDTSNKSPGTYTILVQVASKGDNSWSSPTSAQTSFELTQSSQPSQPSQPTQPPSPSQGPSLSVFTLSRSSATVGDQVTIHIKVNSTNPGATKINVSCGTLDKNETSEVEFYSNWYTSGCGEGNAIATVYSRAVDDKDWVSPTVTNATLYLSLPQSSVASPTANFYADSSSITKGNCTYIHWSTSNANSVDIDGEYLEASGSLKVCPTVTKKYTLTAHGQNSNASRNLTIVVTTQSSSNNTSTSGGNTTILVPQTNYVPFNQQFPNGHVIEIYGNIFVIVDFQRHLVPNPDTLDALGISRNMIDNKGYSPSELEGIPQGSDIPDVNRDYAEFVSFCNTFLGKSIEIDPETQKETAIPQSNPNNDSLTSNENNSENNQETYGYALPGDGYDPGRSSCSDGFTVCAGSAQDLFIINQCTWFVAGLRQDVGLWMKDVYPRSAYLWTTYAKLYGSQYGITVSSTPEVGDIAVWDKADSQGNQCGGANSENGHVAYVYWASGNQFKVNEIHWSEDRTNKSLTVIPCMSFIHKPTNAGQSSTSIQSDSTNNNDQTDQPSILTKISNWFKSLFSSLTNPIN